jgi:hypothetical protein
VGVVADVDIDSMTRNVTVWGDTVGAATGREMYLCTDGPRLAMTLQELRVGSIADLAVFVEIALTAGANRR